MPKYNIYKIHNDKKTDLIRKLESVGLELVSTQKADNFTYDFYFSKNPTDIDIWWVQLYEDFLQTKGIPKNKAYFGVLLLQTNDICYAISLGKSHFYLKQYCDSDFGLNLAERIVDYDKLKVKNSKLFGGRRNKTIISYQQGTTVEFDSGESMQYIKASTIDEKRWGKTVSFGQSVQFTVDISPKRLPNFIQNIEAVLAKKRNFLLPRVEEVKDTSKTEMLDKKLSMYILNSSSTTTTDEFSVSGVDFVFAGDYEYAFYHKSKPQQKNDFGELSLQRLRKFINDYELEQVDLLKEIKVRIKSETGVTRTETLKPVLDYVDDDRYCLIDGKWYKFTQSYVDFLRKEADKITIEPGEPNVIPLTTKEDDFNKARVKEGYLNFDKDLALLQGLKLEKMDLYKEQTLYFVKIGSAQKLTYTIDQSMATVNVLQNKADKIVIDDVEITPKNICLWFVFKRETNVKKLSNVKSLIFLMKIAEWRKTVQNAGYSPVVKITYKR